MKNIEISTNNQVYANTHACPYNLTLQVKGFQFLLKLPLSNRQKNDLNDKC